ncbi:MAG: DUF4091 domain-containing protein [Bryobacterales bacterium]|nr:DUF4091 domain-containing protein [Bryobacterales bacterium]
MSRLAAAALVLGAVAAAQDLKLSAESRRPDPFGGIVAADSAGGAVLGESLRLASARGNYVSCHLAVLLPDGGDYQLRVSVPPRSGLEAGLFREWFHRLKAGGAYYPDALVPVDSGYSGHLPDRDNRIERQTAQAFWLDIWIPPASPPGVYDVVAAVSSGGKSVARKVQVEVLAAVVPPEDALSIDHNSYGSQWLAGYYPSAVRAEGKFFASPSFFRLIHDYHRLFYEHRGIFHQLGYGHGGKVGPEFAPALAGEGRKRHIASWDLYDRHYGPLLDGTAFAQSRRPDQPIPYVYLPVNPEWPASFVNWGEPGYEVEFVNVVSEMERHFREKGWTKTRFELFFNHKKRYKAFPWDGDETRFPRDYEYFREYRRLLDLAVPKDSPVRFVFRTDASWTMEQQFKELAGVINFWVCGGGMFSWYPEAVPLLKGRGDIVWSYGGTPSVDQPPVHVATGVARAWMWNIDGFVRWLTTDPGSDPWFNFGGGDTVLAYPGDRFGISGPIPSLRLKVERNVAADLAMLKSIEKTKGPASVRTAVARQFNGTTPEQWWTPRPPLAGTPPQDWSNDDLDKVPQPDRDKFDHLDPDAWQRVRNYILEQVKERP